MQSAHLTSLAGRSPGLNAIRQNPFHTLGIHVQISQEQAIWQAEKQLALARVGSASREGDLLGWLEPPDELEILQAVQHVEEPMRRLLAQLQWFDFATDPCGVDLERALRTADAELLRGYLQIDLDPVKGDADEAVREDAQVAHEINHVNLQLLLGLCVLHGVGPAA